MKKLSATTIDMPAFGSRRYTDTTDVSLYNPDNNTFAAFYGARFYKTMRLSDEGGHEISLLSVLGYDKDAHFCASILMEHLNSANQIVINKGVSRTHWKLATQKKDLRSICSIASNKVWSRVIKLLEEKKVIAKATVKDQKAWLFNPLFKVQSSSPDMQLSLINAFWPSIKEQLTSKAIIGELEYLLSEWNCPSNANREASPEEAEAIMNDDYFEEIKAQRHDDIFTEYILDGEDPVIWHEDKWNKDGKACSGYFVGKADENEFFTPNSIQLEDERGKGRKASNVTAVRNLYIDIDAGKDAEGNYLSLTEVAERKAAMKKVMATLPAPTATVETRNGFHLYWSISKEDQTDIERGKALLKKLVRTVSIADKAASDISRLLRLPGSIHHKNGLEPFQVNIMEANAVRYSFDEIEAYLDNNIASIEAACQLYTEEYPEALQKTSLKEKSKVIQFPKSPLYNELRGSDNDVEKCHSISMRNFLADMGYDAWGTKFKCVLPLHDDETGDAVIYDKDGAGQAYDVYVCHCSECSEKGLDIIGLVRAMYSCSFKEAVSFLLDYAESLDKNIA